MKTVVKIKKIARRYVYWWAILLLALLAPVLQAQTLDSAKDYFQRGNERRERGQLKQAIADYDRAIELDPRMASAFRGRAVARQDLGDLAGALTDFDRAIDLDPQSYVAYFGRGTLHRIMGDSEAELADLNQALQLNPRLTEAYN